MTPTLQFNLIFKEFSVTIHCFHIQNIQITIKPYYDAMFKVHIKPSHVDLNTFNNFTDYILKLEQFCGLASTIL